MPGVASSTRSPRKSCIARTRPGCSPATSASPTCMRPRWTSSVTTAPRPGSSRDSITKPGRLGVGVGLQLLDLGQRDQRLEQVVEVLRGSWPTRPRTRCRRPSRPGVRPCWASSPRTRLGSAPSLSILLTATIIGTLGGLGVVDRLDGLRHHAVVGGHHDHRDVGDLGAAGAHGREGLVARRVEEGDRVVVVVHLVGADVLGDPAGLARRHLGLADGVEQRGLAVVHVAHDGDHRRAVDQVAPRRRRTRAPPRPRRRRG